jgi:hypothetical protein
MAGELTMAARFPDGSEKRSRGAGRLRGRSEDGTLVRKAATP